MSSPGIWIDSHCHLTDPRFAGRLEKILQKCLDAGISHFIQGGVSPEEWDRQRALKARFPSQISLAFGLHPWWVHENAQDQPGLESALARLEAEIHSLVAIGEAGLDFARKRRPSSGEVQLWAFQKQLELAQKYAKPLVLHVVHAHAEALAMLSKRGSHRGLIHSFSGTFADAKRYVELGFLLSINSRALDDTASELQKVLREFPLDSLVFETDSPDQAPAALKEVAGFEHTPQTLRLIAKKVSELRGIADKELLNQSTANLLRVFNLNLYH